MSMAWIAAQIQQARESGALQSPQLIAFNPRPPGAPIGDSATTATLALLTKNPARWFTHQEIQAAINAQREEGAKFSRVSVDWALIRLASWSLIERVPDHARNPRYLRYRLSKTVKE